MTRSPTGMDIVHVGFGNYVAGHRIVDYRRLGSAPIQRLIRAAKRGEFGGPVIDVTIGRRTKAAMFMDTGHIILVAITQEAIAGRMRAARREGE